jgi:hypothetical protein
MAVHAVKRALSHTNKLSKKNIVVFKAYLEQME